MSGHFEHGEWIEDPNEKGMCMNFREMKKYE